MFQIKYNDSIILFNKYPIAAFEQGTKLLLTPLVLSSIALIKNVQYSLAKTSGFNFSVIINHSLLQTNVMFTA